VRVRQGQEEEYLAATRALAALARSRGWHLWVFRSPDQPGLFLECSERPSRAGHRSLASRPEDERQLEDRLRAVAVYEDQPAELWEECD
jgi:hypothetical protein